MKTSQDNRREAPLLADREERDIGVREAGKRGGLRTKALHGTSHFRLAGRKGQAIFASRYNMDDRRRWGALGGRPTRRRYQSGGDRAIQ